VLLGGRSERAHRWTAHLATRGRESLTTTGGFDTSRSIGSRGGGTMTRGPFRRSSSWPSVTPMPDVRSGATIRLVDFDHDVFVPVVRRGLNEPSHDVR
jgi:hypothetical protein